MVPKAAEPRKTTNYKPISLCNVIYRIIVKAIANRMKPILDQIISPTQRFIFTATFSMIINGVPTGLINPERGLRQGYPFFPYLFIICAEAFSNLLVRAKKDQLIRGLKFAKDVSITHLLFADDSLVFSRASVTDCKHLKEIFDLYATAPGKIFNFQKSSMFFNNKIPEDRVAAIRDISKLNVVFKYEKYLGLPLMIGKKKTSFFNEVKLRVLSKIAEWQLKMFSSGGKEVLIKAAAQAIPAYAMSVFKLLKGLYEGIQRAIAKF